MVYTNNYCISINFSSIKNNYLPYLIRVEKKNKARSSGTGSDFVVIG